MNKEVLTVSNFKMIHLLFDKGQTWQNCEITPTQETYVSLFVEIYCITSRLYFVCPGSKFGFPQEVAVKICIGFPFIWLIMSAKRTYAEVVSGDDHTPDDGQSWMRAYQQESEEDALKKAIQLSKV